MAQIYWKYENKEGNTFDVSLYHGEDSGHVLIYSGHEIISIDFGILSAKTYSFMLNEELFEIGIDFAGKSAHYSLQNIDTGRRIPEFSATAATKKHLLTSVIILILFLLFIFLMIFVI